MTELTMSPADGGKACLGRDRRDAFAGSSQASTRGRVQKVSAGNQSLL